MNDLAQDHATISQVLKAARAGGSNLRDLAMARDLADRNGLGLVTAEINAHIRDRAPGGNIGGTKVALSIAIGILCGLLTQGILFAGRKR